jgi:AraC-like DNA-binding protein
MNQEEEKRQKQRVLMIREELIERANRLLTQDGTVEALPGFYIARWSEPREFIPSVYQPAFCFAVQGGKRVLLGEEVFRYDTGHYMLYTVDLPLVFQVEKASKEKPYLGFNLRLDPALVAEVMIEAEVEPKKSDGKVKAINADSINADLLDAVVRLFRLFDAPKDQKMMVTLITKEIIYRLLTGGQGARLSHLIASAGDTSRISQAIGHLRKHFDEPLKVEEIARKFGMSVSVFHLHFKSVTAMSPLQFQKQIRLQEARRLMLGDDLDAASAGFRVGYEDPAYFSRDYKKLFGAPPQRDIAKLRGNLNAKI